MHIDQIASTAVCGSGTLFITNLAAPRTHACNWLQDTQLLLLFICSLRQMDMQMDMLYPCSAHLGNARALCLLVLAVHRQLQAAVLQVGQLQAVWQQEPALTSIGVTPEIPGSPGSHFLPSITAGCWYLCFTSASRLPSLHQDCDRY